MFPPQRHKCYSGPEQISIGLDWAPGGEVARGAYRLTAGYPSLPPKTTGKQRTLIPTESAATRGPQFFIPLSGALYIGQLPKYRRSAEI